MTEPGFPASDVPTMTEGYVVVVVSRSDWEALSETLLRDPDANQHLANRIAHSVVWANAYGDPSIAPTSPRDAVANHASRVTKDFLARATRMIRSPFTRHA